MPMRSAIFLLYFLSGASALIYQVVWVRLVGDAVGHTTYSAALVTSVFIGGLGVGSYVVGRSIDRVPRADARQPLMLYGRVEVFVAVGGFVLALVLPALADWMPATTYSADGAGWWRPSPWSRMLVYGVAGVLIAPMSLLMGSTLTLLIRYALAGGVAESGWRIGLLYGINTAGAAAGALLTDFALVPQLGLFQTQLVAVALNLVAGLGASFVGRTLPGGGALVAVSARQAAPIAVDGRVRALAVALFCSGFAAMAIEIIWFRHLISVLGGYRSIFSLLMTVLLVGLWLGAMAGGLVDRRTRRPLSSFIVAQTLFIVSVLAFLPLGTQELYASAAVAVLPEHVTASVATKGWLETGAALKLIVVVVGLPSFFMGFAFPLANAYVQRVDSTIGQRAGALYMANTTGNVLGALAAGFVMLPVLGVQLSVVTAVGVAALGLLPVLTVSEDVGMRKTLAVCFPVVLGSLVGWSILPPTYLLEASKPPLDPARGQLLTWSEGINETLAIEEVYGEKLRLITNGHSMSTTRMTAQRYMRFMVHMPLLHVDSPSDVLVICFGVGNSLHAASLHPTVERMHIVDTSANVLEHASYFSYVNQNVLQDERVRVVVDDGRHFLRHQPNERFDLITLEPPPITFAGISSLYSKEFYQTASERLKDGGILSQWLPIYQVPAPVALSMIRSFVDVFPDAVLVSGSWTELVLMGRKNRRIEFHPEEIRDRLRRAPAVLADLNRISIGDRTHMLGSFVAGPRTLDEVSRDAAPVTDDDPRLEYAFVTSKSWTMVSAALFQPRSVAAWCPDCAEQLSDGERAALGAYLDISKEIYRSAAFRDLRKFYSLRIKKTPLPLPLDEEPYRSVVANSRYLRGWINESGWAAPGINTGASGGGE